MMTSLPNAKSAIWEAETEAEIRKVFPQMETLLAKLSLSEEQTRIFMEGTLKFIQNKRPEAEKMLKDGLGPLGVMVYKMLENAVQQRSAAFKREHKLTIN